MGLTAAIVTFQKKLILLSRFLLCIILFTVLILFDQYLCKLKDCVTVPACSEDGHL